MNKRKLFTPIVRVPIYAMLVGTFFCTSTALAKNAKAKQAATQTPSSSREIQVFGELKKHSAGVGLGQTVLFGDMGDRGEDKITLDLFYTYSASYSFEFIGNVHYSEHKFRGQQVTLPGVTTGVKAKLFQYDSFAPFAFGGVGFYRPKLNRTLADGSQQRTEAKWTFGTHFGIGADLRLNKNFTFGLITQYHNPFDVKQEIGPEIEGSYLKVLLTTMYTF